MSIDSTAAAAIAGTVAAITVVSKDPTVGQNSLDLVLLVICTAGGLWSALKITPKEGFLGVALFFSGVFVSIVFGYLVGQGFGEYAEQHYFVKPGFGDKIVGGLTSLFLLRFWDFVVTEVPTFIRTKIRG